MLGRFYMTNKRYLIEVASSGRACYIAGWNGDPGRTLLKESARVFVSKEKADKAKLKLDKQWPNRAFKVIEL